jgi:hypothetical protein
MLDSLVRVSRRVGGAADLLATEMPAAPEKALAIQADSSTRRPRRQRARARPPKGRRTSPRTTFHRQRFVAHSPGEVQPTTGPTETPSPRGSQTPEPPSRQPESPRPASRAPPFTTTQFHVLLNSLFKVLFNFPSRYLFAIGLGVIFSLTWSLPRTLSCTPKQLDSRGKSAQRVGRLTGLSPSTGRGPSQGGLGPAVSPRGDSPEHHIPRDRRPAVRCWALPVSFAITKGITVVFFSSAY